jgi:hypothetical protein
MMLLNRRLGESLIISSLQVTSGRRPAFPAARMTLMALPGVRIIRLSCRLIFVEQIYVVDQ